MSSCPRGRTSDRQAPHLHMHDKANPKQGMTTIDCGHTRLKMASRYTIGVYVWGSMSAIHDPVHPGASGVGRNFHFHFASRSRPTHPWHCNQRLGFRMDAGLLEPLKAVLFQLLLSKLQETALNVKAAGTLPHQPHQPLVEQQRSCCPIS